MPRASRVTVSLSDVKILMSQSNMSVLHGLHELRECIFLCSHHRGIAHEFVEPGLARLRNHRTHETRRLAGASILAAHLHQRSLATRDLDLTRLFLQFSLVPRRQA